MCIVLVQVTGVIYTIFVYTLYIMFVKILYIYIYIYIYINDNYKNDKICQWEQSMMIKINNGKLKCCLIKYLE